MLSDIETVVNLAIMAGDCICRLRSMNEAICFNKKECKTLCTRAELFEKTLHNFENNVNISPKVAPTICNSLKTFIEVINEIFEFLQNYTLKSTKFFGKLIAITHHNQFLGEIDGYHMKLDRCALDINMCVQQLINSTPSHSLNNVPSYHRHLLSPQEVMQQFNENIQVLTEVPTSGGANVSLLSEEDMTTVQDMMTVLKYDVRIMGKPSSVRELAMILVAADVVHVEEQLYQWWKEEKKAILESSGFNQLVNEVSVLDSVSAEQLFTKRIGQSLVKEEHIKTFVEYFQQLQSAEDNSSSRLTSHNSSINSGGIVNGGNKVHHINKQSNHVKNSPYTSSSPVGTPPKLSISSVNCSSPISANESGSSGMIDFRQHLKGSILSVVMADKNKGSTTGASISNPQRSNPLICVPVEEENRRNTTNDRDAVKEQRRYSLEHKVKEKRRKEVEERNKRVMRDEKEALARKLNAEKEIEAGKKNLLKINEESTYPHSIRKPVAKVETIKEQPKLIVCTHVTDNCHPIIDNSNRTCQLTPPTSTASCMIKHSMGCASNEILELERRTLTDFYKHSHGFHRQSILSVMGFMTHHNHYWKHDDHWGNPEIPVSEWFGVSVDPISQRVVAIDLRNNNVAGKLPKEWATSLTSLKRIDLGLNRLRGKIPEEWGVRADPKQETMVGSNIRFHLEELHLEGNPYLKGAYTTKLNT